MYSNTFFFFLWDSFNAFFEARSVRKKNLFSELQIFWEWNFFSQTSTNLIVLQSILIVQFVQTNDRQ